MQQQLDMLVDEPRKLARRNDPGTSKGAAERVREFGQAQRALIVSVLKRFPGGLTVHEIAVSCRLDAHSIGKRCGEIEDAGQIEVVLKDDGEPLTRATPSGRQARVWRAVR